MAAFSTLKDGFQDNQINPTLFTTGFYEAAEGGAVVTEESQQARITCAASTAGNKRNGYISVSAYDLTSDACYVRLVQKATENQTIFALFIDADTSLSFQLDNTDLNVYERTFASNALKYTAAYNATTHGWLRIREASGSIFFDVAPSTASNPPISGDWTNVWTETNPFAVTALRVNLAAGTFQSEASPGAAIFDGLNGATTQTNGSLPTITSQPAGLDVYEGDVATYAVSATASAGSLSYQWKNSGTNVGIDSASYSEVASTAGSITVVVTDDNGSTTSSAAKLGVRARARAPRRHRASSTYDYTLAGWFSAQFDAAGQFDADMVSQSSGLLGALAKTLDALTVSSAGAVDIAGQLSKTLAAMTTAATGALDVSGAGATTLGAATLASTGTLGLTGSEATTLGAATVSATGAVALAGSSAVTLAAVTAAATGTLPIAGDASVTLALVTTAANGTLPIVGATSSALAALTSAATGALALVGDAAQTLADATLLAEGEGGLDGVAAIVLADLTATASGTLPIAAGAAVTLDDATSAATSTIALTGASALTLAAATLSAAATLALAGAGATQLADATLNAAGALVLDAAAAIALDDLALNATGELAPLGGIIGAAAIALDDLSVTAASSIAIAGSTNNTLAALSLSAAGRVDIASALGITFGDLTLEATGETALTGSAAVLLADLGSLAAGALTTYSTRLSAQHAAWLEGVVRLHGLVDPLEVGPALRGDGTVVQSIGEVAGVVTLTTLAAPTGAIEDSALTLEQAGWLEALARLHGLIDPLVVDAVGRGDGTVQQTISTNGATMRVERLA